MQHPADIAVDVTRLLLRGAAGRRPTGIDRVMLAYAHHYGGRGRAAVRLGRSTVVLPAATSARVFEALRSQGRLPLLRLLGVGLTAVWRSVVGAMARGTIVLNVGHAGLEHKGYGAWLRRHGAAAVYMVHDLIPITHPEYSRPGERRRHERRMQTVLDSAALVVGNSAATLARLADYAHRHAKPLPPAIVARLAPAIHPAACASTHASPPLAAPYFVMLGTIEARKNHLMILQVWRRLAERLGGNAPRLVLLGRRGWECEQALDLLDRAEALRGLVSEHGDCDDAQVAHWLRHARALLFPSFTEGYGLPLAEAMALGTPVIASDLAVFREVAAEGPLYLDPLDAAAWLEAVLECMAGQSPAHLHRRGLAAAWTAPDWQSHFACVDAALESVRAA